MLSDAVSCMWWVRHIYNDDEAESDTMSSLRRQHEIVRTLQGRSLQFLNKKNQHAVWVPLPSLLLASDVVTPCRSCARPQHVVGVTAYLRFCMEV